MTITETHLDTLRDRAATAIRAMQASNNAAPRSAITDDQLHARIRIMEYLEDHYYQTLEGRPTRITPTLAAGTMRNLLGSYRADPALKRAVPKAEAALAAIDELVLATGGDEHGRG